MGSPETKRSRRHHILPEMYQVRFASNRDAKTPQVEVFDRNKGEWRTQAVRKTAVRRDYYTVTVPDGQTGLSPDEVEKWLSQIEGATADILSRKVDRQRSLGPDERWMIGLFIATLRMRNPFVRERLGDFVGKIGEKIAAMIHHRSLNDPDYFRSMLEQCARDTGEDLSSLTAESLDPKNFRIEATDSSLIGLSFSHVIRVAHILAKMQWTVFGTPEETRFLTCDNPYFEINPRSRSLYDRAGLLNPNVEVTVPLSSTQFLLISHQKTRGGMYHRATERQWRTLNHRVFLSMQNLIITHSRDFTSQEEPLQAWIKQSGR